MKTRVSLRYFVSCCLWKRFFYSNSPKTPSNLVSLTFLLTIRLFALLQLKIREFKWQKSRKACLVLPDFLTISLKLKISLKRIKFVLGRFLER